MSKRKAEELEDAIDDSFLTEVAHFALTHLQAPPVRVLGEAQKRLESCIEDLHAWISSSEQHEVLATLLDSLSKDVHGKRPTHGPLITPLICNPYGSQTVSPHLTARVTAYVLRPMRKNCCTTLALGSMSGPTS